MTNDKKSGHGTRDTGQVTNDNLRFTIYDLRFVTIACCLLPDYK